MQVIHFIVGLNKGGAETMLYNICKFKSASDLDYTILSLGKGSYYVNDLLKLGFNVQEMDIMKSPILSIRQICSEIKKCDVFCCWMYHCNLIGYILAKLCKVPRVIWCIRHSNISIKYDKISTVIINRICSLLSNGVNYILYNGTAAKNAHEAIGYSKERSIVVNNGCDIIKYTKIDADKLRQKLGILDKRILLSISRYDPIKDIPNFIKAFSLVHKQHPNTVAIMCGKGITIETPDIENLINDNGLIPNKDIYLLGQCDNLEYFYSMADLYILHSASEAFPNTLIEAMACQCICVSTDVGDVAKIVETNTKIVPPNDSILLANAINETLLLNENDRKRIGNQNREIIKNSYSIQNIVKTYENIFLNKSI